MALLFPSHFLPVPTVNGAIFSSPFSRRLSRCYFLPPMTDSIIHHDWKHVSGERHAECIEKLSKKRKKKIASPGNNLENDLGLLGLCAARWPIQALIYVRRTWIVISTLKLIHASLRRDLCVSSTAQGSGRRPFSQLITALHGCHILCRPMCTWSSNMLRYVSNCIQ